MMTDHTLDALGLFCPLPIILTERQLKRMQHMQILEVLSDDPGIEKDMPLWCEQTGNALVTIIREGPVFKAYVRKGLS